MTNFQKLMVMGMRSHVVFLLCILLVFSFLQVIGDNVVMVNFVSMVLNICLCFLAFDVWRFWVVYVLCCATFGGM